MILCHTSRIFCGRPIIFSVTFRIQSIMLSICCFMGISCSVIVVIHSVIFTMKFFTGIFRNALSKPHMLSLTECVWEFQNNALWDTH